MPAAPFAHFQALLHDHPLPCALVDLDALERNLAAMLHPIAANNLKMRIATKSLRVPALVEHCVKLAGDHCAGLMTYCAAETLFWAQRGCKDLLLAYPTAGQHDAELLVAANRLSLTVVVVDDVAQLAVLEQAAQAAGVTLPVAIDLDVSWRVAGQHLGVRRSPVREPDQAVALADAIAASPHLRLHGLQAYEAQIAGLTDSDPRHAWENPLRRWLKGRSMPDVMQRRADAVAALRAKGHALHYVNGGGSGSVHATVGDPSVTEVTVGSALFGSTLFSAYRDLATEPALAFALQVVRNPAPNLVTCHGGGFVASGAVGPDRLPQPWMPAGLALLAMEGAGEVQTPLVCQSDVSPNIGDAVLFRHAKAGELAEHFNDYLLIRAGAVVGKAATYRGLGHAFLG